MGFYKRFHFPDRLHKQPGHEPCSFWWV